MIDSQNGITWNGYDSPRAGGSYRVATDAAIGELSAEEKARLTTWLVDQRLQGNQSPGITETTIKSIKTKRSLQVHERADRLLRFIAQQSQTVSNRVLIDEDELRAYAWSESIEWQEVSYFLEYLRETAWIDGDFLGSVVKSTWSKSSSPESGRWPGKKGSSWRTGLPLPATA